jgi:hypothetical protein
LAAQHGKLVAEHGDLDVLGVLASQASKQHAEESACREVEEGRTGPSADYRSALSLLLSALGRVSEP